jgi:hypothetical protein
MLIYLFLSLILFVEPILVESRLGCPDLPDTNSCLNRPDTPGAVQTAPFF